MHYVALHTIADPHQKPAVQPRRRKGKVLFILAVVLLALAGGIVYPPTFLFAVRQVLGFEARRYGFHLSIGRMEGSVMDPIWLYNARLSCNSDTGASTMLEIDSARTSFAWQHILWQRDGLVWQDLKLDGVRGDIDLRNASQAKRKTIASPFRLLIPAKTPRLPLPASLEISRSSVVIRHSGGSVEMDDIDLHASNVQSGRLVIGAVSVKEPWMTGLYSNCRGTLLIQGTKLMLANMKLTDALTIASASADLPELLRGRLQMQFALDAFSGNVQGELNSSDHDDRLVFDGGGTFSSISVAQLAAFFGEDADGSITKGKFTFHGSPRDLEKATFTTYFEAGDFRWGARRWNSLVAGATYVDHRLQRLSFQLTQAGNSLALEGNMSVPNNWKQWWKTDFSFDVAAKIDNLGELSALLGPGFEDISGKLTADGSVRGENASFNGQLIVSGSHLSFRKAPLDQLQAAIKLNGNEIDVTNAEFTHGDDYLRAQGEVNILGEKRYSGEVKASIADLSLYAAFLQPPIAPEAFGGGLVLDWSGDGEKAAHSGAFTLKLNRLRPLASGKGEAPAWQPIDLNAEATYSPESIFFSKFELGNSETTLDSTVVATPRSLTLQGVKIEHDGSTWLSGDAQVPLNVWAAWENPGTASWWNFESPCKLDLKLDRLPVRDTLFLSGRQEPFDGELTGNFKSDGTLAKLTANGHLAVKNAGATVPAGILKDAGATLDFNGDHVAIGGATGNWNGIAWSASGNIAASDVRKPTLDLSLNLPAAPLALGKDLSGTAALDLRATGQPAALALSGSAQLQDLKIARRTAIESLVTPGGIGLQGPPLVFEPAGQAAWKLDVQAGGDASLELANASGRIAPALEVTGSIAHPILSGKIDVKGFSLTEGTNSLNVPAGMFYLTPSAAVSLALRATGTAGGQTFDGYIYGMIGDKEFTWDPGVTTALTGKGAAPKASPSPAKP
ncbi:MAG: hypothetical protein ABSE62_09075 [Chthoniobacteraceae bacterium]|jgi:hypothetical protein